jgi:hypothetical protein
VKSEWQGLMRVLSRVARRMACMEAPGCQGTG